MRLLSLIGCLFILGCANVPRIIAVDKGKTITQETSAITTADYSWLLWYIPLILVVVFWLKKEFSKKGE